MTSTRDLLAAVGPAILRTVVTGRDELAVRDVYLAEPPEPAPGQPGDLVLGFGLGTVPDAIRLLQQCARGGASGLVLGTRLARRPEIVVEAGRVKLALAELPDGVSWAHLVWLLRSLLDRSAAEAPVGAGPAGVFSDLFAVADTVAAIVDAPVTIEDNHSRVLAYSSGQSETDTARVATIVGRRVPADIVAHFRASGVFRRLAQSDAPFLVPEGPDGTRPRLVVPVRAGAEWLGSIWAVVNGPVDESTTQELRTAASVLALHLLRWRAQADLDRRGAADRLRSVLWQYSPEQTGRLELPGSAPWRVVALTGPGGPEEQLELWETTAQRHGWARPLLADLDGTVFAVVTCTAGPGSWAWARGLAGRMHREDPSVAVAAGAPAAGHAELPRSRAEAAELLDLVRDSRVPGPASQVEDAWAEITVHRAAAALDPGAELGPLTTLARHDATHDTDYVDTLEAWLWHPSQPQRAAAELRVHPNTVRYRMRRIEQLVDLALDDPVQRLALQLQIVALRARSATSAVPGRQGAQLGV